MRDFVHQPHGVSCAVSIGIRARISGMARQEGISQTYPLRRGLESKAPNLYMPRPKHWINTQSLDSKPLFSHLGILLQAPKSRI